VLLGLLLVLAGAPEEPAEAEVAVSDEWAHAARLGQGQRVVVAGLAGLRLEPVGMGRDLSQQVPGMGQEPALGWRGVDHPVAEPPRLVEPAEQQTGAAQGAVPANLCAMNRKFWQGEKGSAAALPDAAPGVIARRGR